MSRYIDADEVLEQIRKKLGIKSLNYLLEAERQIVDAIQSAPSIDICFCRECKCRKHRVDFQNDYCIQHSKVLYSTDGYCSWGEREGE